jgi:hypothetical protein
MNASEFAESTRVHVAGEVMHNLNWVAKTRSRLPMANEVIG